MINYLKSEQYRLMRKKSLHITSAVCLLLIVAVAAVLYSSKQADPNFPYATTRFFYSNIIGGSGFIIIVSFLFNFSLTGKDTALLKNAVSFGVSRATIFWSKLILTLGYFLVVSVIGIGLMIALGETLLTSDGQSVDDFLTALVNMLPIILSAFFTMHSMKMVKVSEMYILIVMLVVFVLLGDLLRIVLRPFPTVQEVYAYAPDVLLHENLLDFMNHTVIFGYQFWIVGALLSVLALLLGVTKFAKQTIE
ncbi:ABC transporter permease [Sporosarcina sp. PTS2304]|uniref:ABC transporter permease n=1 Tax=Sporosarcina sp. PTS2304 TaxID=2283194 RepID=UPI000E0CC8C2|nr:ABC transporter permease [Sporosarcina sp. PTS2304]AXH99214.1 ABC transporter permease [Sporosarcina sp. PTS2304]